MAGFPKVPPPKAHSRHLFNNLGSQMSSLEVMIPGSGVGLGISVFNKHPSDSYGEANVGNTIQPLILIHETIIPSFFYSVI